MVKVTVQEKLFRALAEQPAVTGIRRERPFAAPVGDDREGETTSEQWREIPDHRSSLASMRRSRVVDANEEGPRTGHRAACWSPPYRRSRAANASTAAARSARVKSGHITSVK